VAKAGELTPSPERPAKSKLREGAELNNNSQIDRSASRDMGAQRSDIDQKAGSPQRGSEERADWKASSEWGLQGSAQKSRSEGKQDKGERRQMFEGRSRQEESGKDGNGRKDEGDIIEREKRNKRDSDYMNRGNGEELRRDREQQKGREDTEARKRSADVERQGELQGSSQQGSELDNLSSKRRKFSPIVWDKTKGGKDPESSKDLRTADAKPAVMSRLGMPPADIRASPESRKQAAGNLEDKATATQAVRGESRDGKVAADSVRDEKSRVLKGRSELREKRGSSLARDRDAEGLDKSSKGRIRKEDRMDRPREGDRRERSHSHHKHRENEDRGHGKHRMHDQSKQSRDKSQGRRDRPGRDRDRDASPRKEEQRPKGREDKVEINSAVQKGSEQPAIGPVAQAEQKQQADPRPTSHSPSVSSSASSALSGEDSPTPRKGKNARVESPEPGQLPESPRAEEEKSQGLLKSRWLEEELSPEEEQLAEPVGSAKKRRRNSEEAEDLGLKRRPASIAGSRSNLRMAEEGEIERAGSPKVKVAEDGSMDRGAKSGSRGDSYERELNKRELEELDEESDGEEELGRPGSVSSDDEGVGNQAVQAQPKVNMLEGCRSVDEFERMNKIDEGEVRVSMSLFLLVSQGTVIEGQ
jgi:hypothetical protein